MHLQPVFSNLLKATVMSVTAADITKAKEYLSCYGAKTCSKIELGELCLNRVDLLVKASVRITIAETVINFDEDDEVEVPKVIYGPCTNADASEYVENPSDGDFDGDPPPVSSATAYYGWWDLSVNGLPASKPADYIADFTNTPANYTSGVSSSTLTSGFTIANTDIAYLIIAVPTAFGLSIIRDGGGVDITSSFDSYSTTIGSDAYTVYALEIVTSPLSYPFTMS